MNTSNKGRKKEHTQLSAYDVFNLLFLLFISVGTYILEKNENIYNAILFIVFYIICLVSQLRINKREHLLHTDADEIQKKQGQAHIFLGKELIADDAKIESRRFKNLHSFKRTNSRRILGYGLIAMYAAAIYSHPNL